MQKRLKLSNIKTCDCFMSWSAFRQFSGHDHTTLTNEYQKNFDAIIKSLPITFQFNSKYCQISNKIQRILY